LRIALLQNGTHKNKANGAPGKFMASPTKEIKKALPQPNSDFYQLVETLPADELAVLKQVRAFMETQGPAHHHEVLG
jgi:hypothetical protein